MALSIKSDRVVLRCEHCDATVEARFTRIGQQSQVETAMKKLNKEANRRGWDLKNDICPRHG